MLKRRSNFQEGGVVQRAYEEYQRRVGQPFQQTVRGGVRGYFGLPLMSDADETGREAYRQAEAIGSIPGVSAPAKIARGAAEVAQTAPALAAGALGLVKRTKKETPISFKADESLLATAQKDVEKAGEKYLFIDDMQRDAQGVIPKKLKNLDRGLTKGDYTEQQIKEAFFDTRKALKDKYGDKLVLYRADAPKEERLADAKTVYMGDESLAKRFEQQGRKAQPYIVDVDDVLGVYTTRSGYYEVIVKKEALEKTAKAKEPKMAKGGMMARNIPGFQEGGANIDPVSGNDVPVGSMPEEVRDDIDAKLSPGEFVLSADVVRFIGLERLMKMRDEAKKGLQRMSEIGQMGNADEVGEESNSTYEDEGFESEIDDILSEIEAEENGRDVNEQTEVMMAEGGFMKSGTDLTKAPKNPVFDVRYYKNDEGSVMYITHINGKPMTPIPEGYKAVTQEEAQKVGQKAEEAAKVEKKPEQESSYDATQLDPSVAKFLENETKEQRDERLGKINTALSNVLPAAAKAMIPGMGLMTLAQKAAGLFADQTRPTPAPVTDALARTPAQIAAGTTAGAGSMIEAAAADAYSRAQDENLGDVAASRAAASAAEAVSRGVDPASAIQAAIEAEQDVVDRGGVPVGGVPSSRSSFTASPPSTAATSPVSSREGASRNLTPAEMGESSVGTPSSEPSYSAPGGSYFSDTLSPMAKGGLVNKRQYPAKKKRGKGLASAKA